MAHTPGPWIYDIDDRPGMEWNIHILTEADLDKRICFMTSDGPSEDNARLIAAAPDLLAACEAYAAWAATVTEGAPDLRPIREQIRAAIAKATKP
jgi:hypothetical protein